MLFMTATQKALLTLDPRDSKGNPARLDGSPTWSVSDPAVATLDVAADGLSAYISGVAIGTAQVNVVADADLDESENREITGTLEVEIAGEEAVTLGINAGPAEEQTAGPEV